MSPATYYTKKEKKGREGPISRRRGDSFAGRGEKRERIFQPKIGEKQF